MTKHLFTAYPQLKHMDKYAQRVAKLVFKKYPQWLSYASVGDWNDERYLDVIIPAPVRPSERDLVISTSGSRFTIHFDWYHAHFDGWPGRTLQEGFADAVQFLDALFREEIIVAITFKDGHWAGSRWFPPEELAAIPAGMVTYTRSWKGTFDTMYTR